MTGAPPDGERGLTPENLALVERELDFGGSWFVHFEDMNRLLDAARQEGRANTLEASRPSDDEGVRAVLDRLRVDAILLTQKHGDPNGTDYEQGVNDHGFRWVKHVEAAIARLADPVEGGAGA